MLIQKNKMNMCLRNNGYLWMKLKKVKHNLKSYSLNSIAFIDL